MPNSLILAAVLIAGGSQSAAPGHAAGPAQAGDGWSKPPGLVQPAQYYRRYPPGYASPPGYAPPPAYAPPPPAGAVVQAPIADDAYVVPLPPPRPSSCGEYRYWNGQACVDARYNSPYLGPRP